MIALSWLWAWFGTVPTKLKLYGGIAVVIVIALLRWRALGIRAAVKALERKDQERAQRIREKIAVARSRHPDGDVDIIERLRDYGAIRHESAHAVQ